jgi:arylsulfatase A
MQADPGQTTDIAAKHPELVRELGRLYDDWFADVSRDELKRFPLPIGHAELNPVKLYAPQSYFDVPLQFASGPGYAHDWLTGWTDVKAKVWFDVDVAAAGEYDIELAIACPEPDAGSRIRVAIGDQVLEATVPAAPAVEIPLPHRDALGLTKYRNRQWASLSFGSVKLPRGPTKLVLEPISMPGTQVMELKHVTLFRR